jgi:putative PEP-CTERM system histidine kinase
VLSESLYTNVIYIWIGNDRQGYRIAFPKDMPAENLRRCHLAFRDPLITWLKTHNHYYPDEKSDLDKKDFFSELNLVLAAPLSISEQLVGLIGLGPEFTGGRYGHDDFDLLSALGSQAASALLVARMAEELSRTRQQEAWDIMSAFILHDIKNAASMLSLIRQNARDHLHDPEFQQDMLDTIDDSLKRMAKVQNRLNALKGDITPAMQKTDICRELSEACRKLAKRLIGLHVTIRCDDAIYAQTDPNLLLHVIENLLLNALEAGASEAAVEIRHIPGDPYITVELTDNGSGLPADLLPDALFEPFRTTKFNGSGIGLWQVRQMITGLSGIISADNSVSGGARFMIQLPAG